MRHPNKSDAPNFVEYNDNNLEHVLAGPDYGQPHSQSCWNEVDSLEYPDYVEEIRHRILTHPIKILLAD